jgi:hypothetical protein
MREWTDERARQLYDIAKNAYYASERKDAIIALGKLAREESSDAAWGLGQIAKDAYYSDERTLAINELGRKA